MILRESPIVEVIEQLIGKGLEIKLYDRHVAMARLTGANKEYINRTIPHIASLMTSSLDVLLKDCEVIVIGNRDAEFKDIPSRVSSDTNRVRLRANHGNVQTCEQLHCNRLTGAFLDDRDS